MNVPEKHRATAHAWVDGADVQRYSTKPYTAMWIDDHAPGWFEDEEYRIKPKPLKLEVGKTYRTDSGLRSKIRSELPANGGLLYVSDCWDLHESGGRLVWSSYARQHMTGYDLIAEVEG